MKMCGDEEDAKDVLQETLFAMARGVRIFAAPRRCRPGSTPSPAASASRSAAAANSRRRGSSRSTRRSPRGRAQVADPRPGPEQDMAGRQVEAALSRAIAALEPKYREVLVLRDIEGLTAPEVAEVLGMSVDAVKSRLHRARLAVRDALLPHLGRGPDAAGRRRAQACPDVSDVSSRATSRARSVPSSALAWSATSTAAAAAVARAKSLKQTLTLCHAESAADVPAACCKSRSAGACAGSSPANGRTRSASAAARRQHDSFPAVRNPGDNVRARRADLEPNWLTNIPRRPARCAIRSPWYRRGWHSRQLLQMEDKMNWKRYLVGLVVSAQVLGGSLVAGAARRRSRPRVSGCMTRPRSRL